MPDITILLVVIALGISFWLNLFQLVLRHERSELAPRRSGGGTSAAAGLAPSGSPALPTPR
mgnify:CR=1 FL=1